jgi:NAD(P)-dependent dehydrogenase (short-subunit alcohol dehydrogenase family)
MDLGLSGATAVVNGGSKGMGRAAAECFAADGAKVAILARGKEALDETVAALKDLGSPDAIGIPTDLQVASSVVDAFRQVGERWGSLNMLVNAAGPGAGNGLEGTTDDEWVEAFDIGTLAAVRCVRAALPLMRKAEWARIVNVSAHSTHRQTPALIAYTASKAALTSASKNMSVTLAPEGILVNTVSPGTFMSPGLKGYLRALPAERGIDPDNPWDAMRAIEEDFGHPAQMGRAGDPAEIGAVIAFLASKRNSYMTGADVNVDGGSDFT